MLLAHLALQTLVRSIDGRVVGRGWVALMLHVVYKGRALPVAWLVRPGKTGHCPEDMPLALVAQGHALLPGGAHGVLLGDGECDGTALHHTRAEAGGSYVCRTGCPLTASWPGETCRRDTLGACSKPGTLIALQAGRVTEAAYGPLMLVCWWAKGSQAPLYVVSHMTSADEAGQGSTKRWRIETFFSDQKSRGFHRHTSPLSQPLRLSRWLMAAG